MIPCLRPCIWPLLATLLVATSGCGPGPEAPHPLATLTLEALWPLDLGHELDWQSGCWSWGYRLEGTGEWEEAQLILRDSAQGWLGEWVFPPITNTGTLHLSPRDTLAWHPFRWQVGPEPPLPLPRVPLDGMLYPHVLALLQDLTRDRFQGIVTHWPGRPVPVRIFPAVSDSVDLALALRQAMAIWNQGPGGPYFREDSQLDWGIQLTHYPDRSLRPPAACRITRLDDQGRPLRVRIEVGNDYDQVRDRPYALRAMVHELGHGLLLWGHSRDRDHILWGGAPPMVAAPSPAERKAASWWRGLPEGLDLMAYGPVSEP